MTVGRTKRGVLRLLAVMPDVLNRASIVERATRGLRGRLWSTGVGDRPLATGCRPLMLLVWVLWSVGVGGVAQADDVFLADQYFYDAEDALKEQAPRRAIEALENYAGVATEREWEFLYIYGTLLAKYGTTVEEVENGHALLVEAVKKLVEKRRGTKEYRAALKQKTKAEKKLEALAEEARRAEALRAGRRFRDCEACPEMVVVPAGTLMMGSPAPEEGRRGNEGPVHRVTFEQPFAVGVYEVTREQYARFVSATGHATGHSCRTYEDGEVKERAGRTWQNPGYEQTAAHPVVCVSWEDARAYVRWLNEETGEAYRFLSEAEWEYVARAGTTTAWYWGESESGQCRHANGADASTGFEWAVSCHDGYARTAPVGRYEANAFGLYDVLGNVWEWTADCWNANYRGAPDDGSAWQRGECSRRVVRGGSWGDEPRNLRSANRIRLTAGLRGNVVGFRLARTLTP